MSQYPCLNALVIGWIGPKSCNSVGGKLEPVWIAQLKGDPLTPLLLLLPPGQEGEACKQRKSWTMSDGN